MLWILDGESSSFLGGQPQTSRLLAVTRPRTSDQCTPVRSCYPAGINSPVLPARPVTPPQDVPTLDQAVLQGGERSQPENQPRLSHSTTFFPFMVNTNTDKINFKLLKMAAKLMNCCQSNLLFISASSPSKSIHKDQGAKVKMMTPCFPIQSEDMREDEEERSLADLHIPAYLLARPEMDLIMCTPPLGCHIVYFRISFSK